VITKYTPDFEIERRKTYDFYKDAAGQEIILQ